MTGHPSTLRSFPLVSFALGSLLNEFLKLSQTASFQPKQASLNNFASGLLISGPQGSGKMGEGGVGYLKGAAGILDTWEFLIGCYLLIHLAYPDMTPVPEGLKLRDDLVAWMVIVGIFALLSLIIMITNIIGCCELPKKALMIFYIIAAVVVFLTGCICQASFEGAFEKNNSVGGIFRRQSPQGFGGGRDDHEFRFPLVVTLAMAIFYAYSAYNINKG